MKKLIWFAAVPPGLEAIVKRELEIEGIAANTQYGSVVFEASIKAGAQIVPELFTPNKLRVLLKKSTISGLADINKALSSISWHELLHKSTPIVVDVHSMVQHSEASYHANCRGSYTLRIQVLLHKQVLCPSLGCLVCA